MTAPESQPSIHDAFAAVKAGDDARALAIAEALLQRSPSDVNALQVAGVVYGRAGRKKDAYEIFLRANRLAPDQTPILNSLGVLAQEFGDVEGARGYLSRATALAPNFAEAHHNYASACSAAGERAEARKHYETALRLAPSNADVLGKFAKFLEDANELDRAKELAERALALDPRSIPAVLTLAEIDERRGNPDTAAARLEAAVGRSAGSPAAVASLHGKLARMHERAGRHAESFAATTRGKRVQADAYGAAFAGLTGPRSPDMLARLIAFARAEDFAQWTNFDAFDDPDPAFLVGFPRSGTTLLDQVLSAHGDVAVIEEKELLQDAWLELMLEAGDFSGWGRLMHEQVARYRASFWRLARAHVAEGRGVVIDKMPLNTALLGLVHRIFPRAKIIFALRDPRDVVLSCFQQMFALNVSMAQFLDLRTAADYYDRVMTLGELWRRRLPLHVHVVRYEDVVRDLRGELEPALSFLGLPWTDDLLAYRERAEGKVIRTPSARQVIKPLYQSSVGKWRHYAAELAPVLPVLEPWARRFGYADAP